MKEELDHRRRTQCVPAERGANPELVYRRENADAVPNSDLNTLYHKDMISTIQ